MKSLTLPCSSTFLEWERYSVMSQSLFSFMYVRNGGNQQRRLRWHLYLLQLLGASYKVSYYSKGELTQLRKYPFYWKLLFNSKPNCMSFSVQLSVSKSDWTKSDYCGVYFDADSHALLPLVLQIGEQGRWVLSFSELLAFQELRKHGR